MFAPAHPNNHCPTQQEFQQFAAKVWSPQAWKRGDPKPSTITAAQKAINCPQHRKGLERIWIEARAKFYAKRQQMIWRETYKPFVYPSGRRWAVPYPIAICESGENYYVGPSGAYGLIPPFPQWLSPRAQDETAHDLYLEQGEGPWAPYEGGCYLR